MKCLPYLITVFGLLSFHSETIYATDVCLATLDEAAERSGLVRLEDRSPTQLRELGRLAKGDAEIASVDFHQDALLRSLNEPFMLQFGLSYREVRNMREGIVKSDMGKLAAYKEWWTTPNHPDGIAMISALQLRGNSPLSALLRGWNQSKPFINPRLPVEVVQQIFKIAFFAPGYFHEFPGMRAAEKELQSGKMSNRDFEEQIAAIYAHNGPGDPNFRIGQDRPFWTGVPEGIMGQISKAVQEGKLPSQALEFFKGTIFEQADGKLKYPDPVSLSGFVHMIEDRFDGFRDSRKIRNEIRFMPPIAAEVDMMFASNFRGTRAALIYNRDQLLPQLIERGAVPREYELPLTDMINNRLERMQVIEKSFSQMIVNSAEIKDKLIANQPISEIVVRLPEGSTRSFKAETLGDGFSPAAAEFRKFFDEQVRAPIMAADRN